MAAVGKRDEADAYIKPECVISSEYDPIKSEETDDEDMYIDDTNTSNLHENHLPINIKEEAVKAEIKTEDDVSTDDEQYNPENVISSAGYDPIKSEETDNEDTEEDTNITSNEQSINIKVKAEVKTEDVVSTDDDCGSSEEKETKRPRKSTRSLASSTTQPKGKRKREEKECRSVQKTVHRICSVEGCDRKAAGNGRCRKIHGGRNYCSQDGCTNKAQKGGVCMKHGAVVKTCNHDGCTNKVQKGGLCVKHGAKRLIKTCSHKGCTNQVQSRGVCIKHGAKVKTCSHEGCTNRRVKGGFCRRHFTLSNRI